MKLINRLGIKRNTDFEKTRTALTEKLREAAVSVLPIVVIVTALCLFIVPAQPELLLSFLIGTLMIV